MRILVTGACGFIGYHTICKLLELGHQLLGLDNLNDYYDVLLKKKRMDNLKKIGCKVLEHDVNDIERLKEIDSFQPSLIIHLAAQAGVRYASINPRSYFESNLAGFFEVLEWLRKRPQIKLIYASSSSVYGNSSEAPYCEEEKADQPESLYAATKRANELLAYSYYQTFNVKSIGLRFFTVYGPLGRPDMAYYHFTKEFLENRPLKVFHQGIAKRDYTYIDDIVEGIVACIENENPCEVYNLGNHKPHTILELISCIEKFFNKKAIIDFINGPQGDVDLTFASISKAQRDLGFFPKTHLQEGMNHFLNWYCQYHNIKLLSENIT